MITACRSTRIHRLCLPGTVAAAFWLLLVVLLPSTVSAALPDGETLFHEKEGSLYQVRVINRSTGDKSSIGSGFVVAQKNLIATNFHVISSYVHEPETYVLEYLSTTGVSGPLKVLNVDVPHDLAVLQADTDLGVPLVTGKIPKKGAPLYAMGNPHDLGMSLTTGINNGVLPQSNDDRIHFSGSLNPGMSGGPTVDRNGRVVGINVATAGNNISFIIPAHYLDEIIAVIRRNDFVPIADLHTHISNQILAQQRTYLTQLIDGDWATTEFGGFKVPGEISPTIRCWDASDPPQPDDLYRQLFTQCRNENEIFLYDQLDVGKISYEYLWLESDALNPVRFYNLYQLRFFNHFPNRYTKLDVTNFHCETRFVRISGKEWKTNLCRRDYVRYPALSDLVLSAAQISEKKQGMIFNLYLIGTDYDSALRLVARFLESFTWQR